AVGDIDIIGRPTFNLIIAKNNITLSGGWTSIEYSTTKIQSILADPLNSFFTTSSQPTLNENVIIGQDVSPAGSI
ncbi:MAG TPA: hypothetical protein VHP30_05895, partial [Ignavibacteriales bacterium]|nr:hypothetical protein [Ignavibacteriales bacterium]